MAEPDKTDERWRELADLLGLSDDAPADKPAPPVPPEKAVAKPPVPAPREVEDDRPYRTEEQRPLEPVAADPDGWESEFDEVDDDTVVDESLVRDDAAGEECVEETEEITEELGGESAPAGAPGSEEDKPRRGRRRRRRGRRGGRDGEERGERAPAAGEPARERPPQTSEPRRPSGDQRDQGGRGGRRREEEPRRSAPPPPRQERRPPEPVAANDNAAPKHAPVSDMDDTDFSNWNVPSWQDLIASLYRPDR